MEKDNIRLGNKLGEYEKALEKHIIQLENDITQRNVQLDVGIKLEITKNQSLDAIKHNLTQDITLFTKKIDEIDFDSLKNDVEKEENVEDLKSDADLVVEILKKACRCYEKEENSLRVQLENVKADTESILSVKNSFKTSDHLTQNLIIKSENEIKKLSSMKSLQDLYIRRLRSDIVYAELSVGDLVGVMTDINKKRKHPFIKFTDLSKTIKNFADPQSQNKNQWKECLSFAIFELHLGSIKFQNSNSDTVDLEANEIKALILFRYQNDNFEKKCDDYRDKLLLLRNQVYHQKEYNNALKLRFIGARIRNKSLLSQILRHSDPTQEKIFEAELKTEIRKFLCRKLETFLERKNNVQTESKDFPETSKYSLITVHLFFPDFRANELLTICQKQRKKFIITERKRAALFFRFQRLQDEVKEATNLNETLITQRKQLEHKLFEIESQFDPFLALQNADAGKQIEAQNDERIRLETMIKDALLEKEKFENETNLLFQELDEIRKRCEEFRQKTGSLSYYQQKHEILNKSLQKITLLLAERHDLLIKQYQIQQKLKTIVSRRECAFNSFATSLQNSKTNANFVFHGESLNEIKSQVSKLKIQIREKRENLLLNSK